MEVILVVAIFVVLAGALAVYLLRRKDEEPVSSDVTAPIENETDLRARHEALERRGAELLVRRGELDSRRGALGGQQDVFDAFEELEHRLRSGQISEEEFEREKVRLLGGPQ